MDLSLLLLFKMNDFSHSKPRKMKKRLTRPQDDDRTLVAINRTDNNNDDYHHHHYQRRRDTTSCDISTVETVILDCGGLEENPAKRKRIVLPDELQSLLTNKNQIINLNSHDIMMYVPGYPQLVSGQHFIDLRKQGRIILAVSLLKLFIDHCLGVDNWMLVHQIINYLYRNAPCSHVQKLLNYAILKFSDHKKYISRKTIKVMEIKFSEMSGIHHCGDVEFLDVEQIVNEVAPSLQPDKRLKL